MSKTVAELKEFATICHRLLRSDRDVVIGVGGFTGEGKTCFTHQLMKEYSSISKMPYNFEHMTWSRAELLTWIDGEAGSQINPNTGLKKGQLPEYSCIVPDELFYMFYRRTWFESGQISAIATFNSCRDRHLLVAGNVPDFWDLDVGFQKRVRFYAYIPERSKAWIFQQENNPFTKDSWNVGENKKTFRKKNNPYRIPNFVCELSFPDFTQDEKKEYYEIRNRKRVTAITEVKQNLERFGNIKDQRDNILKAYIKDRDSLTRALVRLWPQISDDLRAKLRPWKQKIKYTTLADISGLSAEAIRITALGKTRKQQKK